MGYSNSKVPLDPKHFPPPQTWALWIENREWRDMTVPTGVGKLRHFHTLAAAKKSMAWVGAKSKYRDYSRQDMPDPGCFLVDWAILEWAEGEWVERYSGIRGQARTDNPLYKRKLTKDEQVDPMKKVGEAAAVESILSTLRQVS